MNFKPLRVNPETITQIEAIAKHRDCSAREVLQEAIQEYWTQNFETLKPKWVSPVESRKRFLEIVTNKSGPYLVAKEFASSTGLSDGVYSIAGTEVLMPASWFQEVEAPKEKPSRLLIYTVFQIVMQLAFLLSLLVLL